MKIKLSQNFTLSELTRSATARRLGLNNTPTEQALDHLTILARHFLQPIRDHFGPVVILSGYRSPSVNAAVGSTSHSAHLWGMAADLVVPGHSTRDVVEWIRAELPRFDQVIDEYGEWVHLGYARPVTLQKRRQVLEACRDPLGEASYRPLIKAA